MAYVPASEKFVIPLTFTIFGEYIAFETDIKKVHIIMFSDSRLVNEFRNFFNMLWQKAVPYNP